MKTIRSWAVFLLILSLLLPLVAACGAGPTATPPEPTPVVEVKPTATPKPTDTPQPTNTPKPTDTSTPEPTVTAEPTQVSGVTFEKAPCPFGLPAGQVEGKTVECGYLVVPEDRADAKSPTIQLAVAIFRNPNGNPEPDPIVYLSGGPGGSVLEFISLAFEQLAPFFAANRDLILFDQRGVGLSKPALDCPKVRELGLELLDRELDGKQLTDQEIADRTLEATLACGKDLSKVADLSAYNTAASAADVNDLHQALGYDKVNLWGVSYGTNLALAVMRDYPEGVRSVILDSVYPPDADLYVEAPANADRAFDVLFEGCAKDQACNAAYPDLRKVFGETVDRLNKTPASFQVTDPLAGKSYDVVVTGDDLVGLVFQFLYYTDVIPSLPQIIYDASQGKFDLVARILGSLIVQGEAMSQGMQFSVQCHDEVAFSSLGKYKAALAEHPELAGFLEYSILGPLSYRVCADWGAGKADATANKPVTSDIPTLLMTGEYDPVTPPDWARHVAKTLKNGHVFEYPGVGHGASTVAGCPRDMMIAFLKDPATAPDDDCIAKMDLPKFVVPTAGAVTIEMVPFTNEQMGIKGVVPAGWKETNPGVYARGSSALDATVLIAQAAPMSAQDLLSLMVRQSGLEKAPESVGTREANGLTWTLYAVEVQGLSVDFALAESEKSGFIVVLQTTPEEHDALYQGVYLSAIDALTPLK